MALLPYYVTGIRGYAGSFKGTTLEVNPYIRRTDSLLITAISGRAAGLEISTYNHVKSFVKLIFNGGYRSRLQRDSCCRNNEKFCYPPAKQPVGDFA